MITIIHSVTIVTLNRNNDIFEGYVTIKNNTFEKTGEGSPPDIEIEQADKVIDGKRKWLLPGFINTHGHLGSALLRGAGDDMPLMTWLKQVMWPNESRFDRETVLQAAQVAMVEMIKSGTTTFLDMYHLHMEETAKLVIDKGLRAVLGRGMIGLCPSHEQEDKLAESVSLFKTFNGGGDGRLSIVLAPHAPYTCPPPFLKRVAETAEKYRMMIHTHVSETRGEVEEHIKTYGKRPVSHLDELGVFNGPVLAAHAVHVNEEEIEILKNRGAAISHNPASNLKLGSGVAPVPDFLEKGITVSLGTDSTASNNNLDMFEEARLSALIHKGTRENPEVTSAKDTLEMATLKGAEALSIDKLGKIERDFKADFILVDPGQAHLTPWNKDRLLSHLVYAARGSDVTDTFIDGKAVYSDRQLLLFDEEKIVFEANQLAKKFL
ncbi:amidohydrolase [Salipaludibacillus sp. CUR1]|uniref:amidohydrolase n=1 Tax=Salipaludibacillus sp. CUR1 TaxID=2820003 RepID=UPI001E52E614|nr:amidohydrolase [Salipaludibacillus sp. CUR1]